MAPTGKNYKKILKDIADNLTLSDVGTIKFVCRGKIGAGSLDRIPNGEPLKLLKLLEERQIISEQNLTWLQGVLKKIQRVDLAMKIPDEFCQYIDTVDSAEMVCSSPQSGSMVDSDVVSPYRELLKTVADDLTRSNVNEMKFLLDVPDGIAEKLCDGQDLLTHLEGSGKLSENNFNDLKDLLSDVYRKDLIKKIEDFSVNEGRPIPSVALNRDPASCYPMQRPYGFALVINNQKFTGTTSEGYILPERRGSPVDLENLVDLWAKLGFIVEKHENLKAHQICTAVDKMVQKIQKNQSSCFVCCIMTHGTMGTIYGSDGNFVNIKHITDSFKESSCPELAGKPKLFFIQACRGRQRLTGRAPFTGSTGSSNSATSATETTSATAHQQPAASTQDPSPQLDQTSRLDSDATPSERTAVTDEDQYDRLNDSEFRHNADPNEAHFLLGYSTAPGYVSMRSIDHGTWYVNAMVKIFSQYYMSEDIMQMMVRVNGLVNEAYSSQGYKQCPVPVFTLAKSVYF